MSPLAPPPKLRSLALSFGVSTAVGALSLLTSLPALAETSTPFIIDFKQAYGTTTPYNGSTAQAEFSFTKIGSSVTLNAVLTNNSGIATTLVGLAFVTPDYLLNPTLASPNTTDFTVLYLGAQANISGGPFTAIDFDVCARSEGSGNNCNGGQPISGLTQGETTDDPNTAIKEGVPISFTFDLANFSDKTAQAIASDFKNLYTLLPPFPPGTPQYNIVARFQQTQCASSTSTNLDCSDKVGGAYDPNKPPFAPGENVPGPLPLLGAAAAFGYSRKLRKRLKAKSAFN